MKFLNRFLFQDYEPLNGYLRVTLYFLLLFLGYDFFFNKLIIHIQNTPELFYEPDGLMRILFGPDHTVFFAESFIYKTRWVLIISWLFAGLGLFGRIPIFLTGILLFLFWGFFKSASGTSHGWHLPVYALLTLAFTLRPDKISLDYIISKYFKIYPFRINTTNFDLSGFARKLILIFAVFTLFAGGVTKLMQGGLEWLSGTTLQYYTNELKDVKGQTGYLISRILNKFPAIFIVLSVWTILLELSSILMIFFKRTRLFIIINAMLFHLGIYFIMLPKYFPQMTVYLILINWALIKYPNKFSIKSIKQFLFNLNQPKFKNISLVNKPFYLLKTVFIIVIIALFSTIYLQKEYYPLTHIPMYSNTLDKNNIGVIKYEDLETKEGLFNTSLIYNRNYNPWYLKFYLPKKLKVFVLQENCWKEYTKEFNYGNINKYLWYQRITKSFFIDIENNSLDNNNFKKSDELFKSLVNHRNKRNNLNDSFLLVYITERDSIIISEFNSNTNTKIYEYPINLCR